MAGSPSWVALEFSSYHLVFLRRPQGTSLEFPGPLWYPVEWIDPKDVGVMVWYSSLAGTA